jgi:hypothetical protein
MQDNQMQSSPLPIESQSTHAPLRVLEIKSKLLPLSSSLSRRQPQCSFLTQPYQPRTSPPAPQAPFPQLARHHRPFQKFEPLHATHNHNARPHLRVPTYTHSIRFIPAKRTLEMSFFGMGGRPQISSEQKIAQAEAEIDMVSDMYSRYVYFLSALLFISRMGLDAQLAVFSLACSTHAVLPINPFSEPGFDRPHCVRLSHSFGTLANARWL